MEIRPIAHIYTNFKEKFGIPRQSGLSISPGRVVFEPEFRDPEALRGLEGFSHIWLIFDFSESHRDGWSPTVRPPRLGGNVRVGVFASRSPFRPNSIGLSSVRLIGVEDSEEGKILVVEGADLLDGTPIYDIKPYVRYSDSHPDAISGFADDVYGKKLDVIFNIDPAAYLSDVQVSELMECLEQDPRPGYHDDDREYNMAFADCDVTFIIKNNMARVVGIRRL